MTSEFSNRFSSTAKNLVVTFITDHPKAVLMLLAAQKYAQEIGGQWKAVLIETPDHQVMTDARWKEHRLRLLTRAQQMGAETEHFEAINLETGIDQVLKREEARLAKIIIGSTEADDRLIRIRPLPWMRLVQVASRYAQVEIVPLAGQYREPFRSRAWRWAKQIEPQHIIYALFAVILPALLATGLKLTLPPALFRINEENIDNLFLISTALIAGRYGLLPGMIAAIFGFCIQNYYFTVPYHAFKLTSVTEVFSMVLFLSTALLIALFSSHMRYSVQKISRRELSTEILFMLYRLTSESYSREQALEVLQSNLQKTLDADVCFFLPDETNAYQLSNCYPNDLTLAERDRRALDACWQEMKSTGAATPSYFDTEWRFEPVVASTGEIGVLGVRPHKIGQLDAWFGRLIAATADQTATILSHIELERSMEASRISEEREKLRAMLLSSVSHDLKTPLAAIIGALSAHQSLGDRIDAYKRNELINGSLEEAQRLDSFITNILDMTRLETGNIKFKQDWHGIQHFTENVVKRMKHRLKQRRLVLNYPPQEIEVFMDPIMTGQLLQNLIDNACKYTTSEATIEINWQLSQEKGIFCEVRDHGEGIPADKLEQIFDKYLRLHKKDSQTAGTGLGLAITKAIAEAQDGWIKASNHPEGGAVFTLFLPECRLAPHEQRTLEYATS